MIYLQAPNKTVQLHYSIARYSSNHDKDLTIHLQRKLKITTIINNLTKINVIILLTSLYELITLSNSIHLHPTCLKATLIQPIIIENGKDM